MKNSIKFIAMIVVMSAVILSCKKVDGPTPSTEAFLTAHTWNATTADGHNMHPEQCNGLVMQFAHDGKFYYSNGYGDNCSAPAEFGKWSLTDKTIKLQVGEIWTITSVDGSNLNFTSSDGTQFTCNVAP